MHRYLKDAHRALRKLNVHRGNPDFSGTRQIPVIKETSNLISPDGWYIYFHRNGSQVNAAPIPSLDSIMMVLMV